MASTLSSMRLGGDGQQHHEPPAGVAVPDRLDRHGTTGRPTGPKGQGLPVERALRTGIGVGGYRQGGSVDGACAIVGAMGEPVERVDDQDRVLAVVERGEAIRRGWLHRIATTICRDQHGRVLVYRRPENRSRFPGHHEVMFGGAVEVGETYEQAAARELAEELGVDAPVRFLFKFLCRGRSARTGSACTRP